MTKLMIGVAVASGLLLAACASESPGAGAPPDSITAEDAVEMTAEAVQAACRRHCGGFDVYVVDEVFALTTRLGEEQAMPPETRQAILERVDGAQMITIDNYHEMYIDGILTDPRAAVVNVGPIDELGQGVAGIDIGVDNGRTGFIAETYQFRWTGSGWEAATPNETGIPGTTSVS